MSNPRLDPQMSTDESWKAFYLQRLSASDDI